MGPIVIILMHPPLKLGLDVVEGDVLWKLPEEFIHVGFVQALDFAVQFLDPGRDKAVQNIQGREQGWKGMGKVVVGTMPLKAVGKFDAVVGLNPFDGKGSGCDKTSNEIEGGSLPQMTVEVGETPSGAIVDRGEEVGFPTLQTIGDVFDIELESLAGAIQLIASGVRIFLMGPVSAQGDAGSSKDFINAGGGDVESPLKQMPCSQGGSISKLLSHLQDLIFQRPIDLVRTPQRATRLWPERLWVKTAIDQATKPAVIGPPGGPERLTGSGNVLVLYPSEQTEHFGPNRGVMGGAGCFLDFGVDGNHRGSPVSFCRWGSAVNGSLQTT
jgi:hypothetical protein